MKTKTAFLVAGLTVIGLMVAPAVEPVNKTANENIADGSPLPAPVPKPPVATVLIADGSPLPAPVPKPPVSIFS